jgi:hypothetical protein
MQTRVKFSIFPFFILALIACTNTPTSSVPSWIDNPQKHQAVGTCGSHAMGKHMQRECAMTRARLELAARQGIEIKSISIMTEQANNRGSSSQLNQQTKQEINSKIKARLVASYHDKGQDILWVLIEGL